MKIKYKDLFWMGLGLFLILFIIYRRLILERLPQEIIFEPTFWKFILISWLVFIYSARAGVFTFIQVILIEKTLDYSKEGFFTKLRNFFMKPFNTLYDIVLRTKNAHKFFYYFCDKNYHFFKHLKNKLWFLESYEIPYIICSLMPRTIVLFALSYDIYHHYFNYFYKTLALLLIPMIYNLLIMLGHKFFINCLPLLEDKFEFIPFQDLSYNYVKKRLYDDNVPFTFKSQEDEKNKNSISFYHYGYTIYKFLLFQHLYVEQLKHESIVYFIDKLINYIFAMLWWYVLFHMILNV